MLKTGIIGRSEWMYFTLKRLVNQGIKEGDTHGRTLGHLGITPIVNMQTAGLKVGQESLENNLSDLSQPINFI